MVVAGVAAKTTLRLVFPSPGVPCLLLPEQAVSDAASNSTRYSLQVKEAYVISAVSCRDED
jgi:hypothetical protein